MTATAGGRGRWRAAGLRWAAAVLLLAVLAGGAALMGRAEPRLDARQLDRLLDPGAGALLRWRGEPRLTLLPTPTVTLTGVTVRHERNHVTVLRAAIPRVEIALDVLPLLSGRIRAEAVRLFDADIGLAGDAADPFWLEFLRAGAALPAALELHDATIRFGRAGRGTHHLHDVDLGLDWSAAEQRLAAAGSAVLRGRRVQLAASLLEPRQLFDPAGARARVRLDGLAGPALHAEGRFQLARVDEPAGGSELRIRDGDFRLGGSTAQGELALSRPGGRPRVSGRLEFGELVLSPYLERWLPDDFAELLALPLSGRWLSSAEADLTLRASAMELGILQWNEAEARVRLRDGRLALTLAEARFANGTLRGTLSAAPAGVGMAVRAAGWLEDVSLAEVGDRLGPPRVDALIGGEDPPQGLGSGSFSVSARGDTVGELVSSLTGRVVTEVRDGSLPGADAVSTLERVLDGHSGIAEGNAPFIPIAGRTYFSRLSARLLAGDGTVWLERLRLRGDAFEIALTGELDLADGELLARGTARLFDADAGHGSTVLVELPFGVGGTLREPMGAPGIPRLEPAPERTARAGEAAADRLPMPRRRDPRVG